MIPGLSCDQFHIEEGDMIEDVCIYVLNGITRLIYQSESHHERQRALTKQI